MESKPSTEHKCNKPGCDKVANLRCPNCKKLGIINASYFCGKECFTEAWKDHLKIHSEYEPIEDDFIYSGQLRRYKVTPKREVPSSIMRPDYADHPEGISKCEEDFDESGIIEPPIYSDDDIEQMRITCKLGRKVLDTVHKAVNIGVTTEELDIVCHEACIENDCYPSPLNYYKFPKSVCTSVNEVICHGIPDMRPLKDGDIVNCDVTVYHRGYHGDLNETYFVGNVGKKAKHLVKATYNCMNMAIDICKPGVKFSEIGEIIEDYIKKEGFSVVKSYTGHGICKLFHTIPTIYHFKNKKTKGVMKAGNIFTIEPMINEGSFQDIKWPDDWTAATYDGKRSAQFEQTILITEDGHEVLTARNENSPKLEFM